MVKRVDTKPDWRDNYHVIEVKEFDMGVIVDIRTGEFVECGDIGNLAEMLQAMYEMEMEIDHLRLYPEDEAYAEVA